MKLSHVAWRVLFVSGCLLSALSIAAEGTSSRTTSRDKASEKNSTVIVIITRGPISQRRSKFPIIPPRLQLKTTATATTTTTTQASTTNSSSALSKTRTTTTESNQTSSVPLTSQNDTSLKQSDIFEQSSSDNSPSIAWPVPRRPASRRVWSSQSPASPGPSTVRPVPKLLLPRPTRPAMYSLDGFVPKPSMIRITTTEAPPHIKAKYSNFVAPKTTKRKWYGRQSLDEDEESELKLRRRTQNSRSKSVSRYTAFKRKGVPGEDYPIYSAIPLTAFDCGAKPEPGMYADPDAGCQVWHMCPGNAPHRYSFMCPNGTIFNEIRGVCDWWYNVICLKSEPMANTLKRRSG